MSSVNRWKILMAPKRPTKSCFSRTALHKRTRPTKTFSLRCNFATSSNVAFGSSRAHALSPIHRPTSSDDSPVFYVSLTSSSGINEAHVQSMHDTLRMNSHNHTVTSIKRACRRTTEYEKLLADTSAAVPGAAATIEPQLAMYYGARVALFEWACEKLV